MSRRGSLGPLVRPPSADDAGPADESVFSSPSGRKSANSKGRNFKVAVRVRPPNKREIKDDSTRCVEVESKNALSIRKTPDVKTGSGGRPSTATRVEDLQFAYDRVFGEDSTQQEIFVNAVQPVVVSVLEGYNGTVLAYGQTGTGKTFTMEGDIEGEGRGIIPRSAAEVFAFIQNDVHDKSSQWLVRCSFCQIYNEKINDLLDPKGTDLKIRESGDGGTFIERLSERVVKGPGEIFKLLQEGSSNRNTNSTRMNATSSRSHAVFTIVVEHSKEDAVVPDKTNVTVGKLHLVDLAGSERFNVTSGEAKHQKETMNINTSLTAFGKVVLALTSRGNLHIPYRDSKLTRILQDSMGGNSKTTMIGTIGPMSSAYLEAVTTLKFANRAKAIKNVAQVNKDNSESAMLTAMQAEIQRLHEELAAKQSAREAAPAPLVDLDEYVQLLEASERSKADKETIAEELQLRQKDVERAEQEREEHMRLIQELEGQLVQGGTQVEETEEFKAAVAKEKSRLEEEAVSKQSEIELERLRLEEEKADFERERQRFRKVSQNALEKIQKGNNPALGGLAVAAMGARGGAGGGGAGGAGPAHLNILPNNGGANQGAPPSPRPPGAMPGRFYPAGRGGGRGGPMGGRGRGGGRGPPPGWQPGRGPPAWQGRGRGGRVPQGQVRPAPPDGSAQSGGLRRASSASQMAQAAAAGGDRGGAAAAANPVPPGSPGPPRLHRRVSGGSNGARPPQRHSGGGEDSGDDSDTVQDRVAVGGWISPGDGGGGGGGGAKMRRSVDDDDISGSPSAHYGMDRVGDTRKSSLAEETETEAALDQYAAALQDPRSGIPLGTRRSRLSTYKMCFSGADAAGWFMAHMEGINTPSKAQVVGQQLLDLGVVTHVRHAQQFQVSDSELFQFRGQRATDQRTETSLLSRGGSMSSLSSRQSLSSGGSGGSGGGGLARSKSWGSQSSLLSMRSVSSSTSYSSLASSNDQYEAVFDDDAESGKSPLHVAAGKGDVGTMRKLIGDYGVENTDSQGRTPLMYAVIGNKGKACKLLVKLGADINGRDDLGNTPLIWGACRGTRDSLKELLKMGADVSSTDNEGRSAIHWSTKLKRLDCLDLLLRCAYRVVVNKKDGEGLSALHWAVMCDNASHAHALLKSQAEPTIGDGEGRSPLHYAVSRGAMACMHMLLEQCRSAVNQPDALGRTPLHTACNEGSDETIALLLSTPGIDVNAADHRLTTPLHWAAVVNRPDVCSALLKVGARLMVRDATGLSPLHYATERGHLDCANVMQRFGGSAAANRPVLGGSMIASPPMGSR